jgi:hypothetical protein
MYLVDLGSGKHELYRSQEELAAAIRKGDVGPQSRIYHRSSCTWLPITVHPEFKRFAAERASSKTWRRQWTFLRDPAPEPAASEDSPQAEEAFPSQPHTPKWRQILESAFRKLAVHHH